MHSSLAPAHARPGRAARAATVVAAAAALVCALFAPTARAQTRVENPFVGATWYVSPEYKKNVDASAAQVSDSALRAKVAKVASYPTAFWLDRIAAINGYDGRMGLAAHLDAALAQQQAGKPVVVTVVVYDLPGRDCSALASNGELGPTEIDKYKTQFIDPIAAIEGNAKYAPLRIVNVIEIDSLPNLVTNTSGKAGGTPLCDTMKQNGNYVAGIQYALGKLHAAGSNTYNYVDAGHHGWLGWDENLNAVAQLFADTVKGAQGGYDTVQGFISNTANYSALVEPYLTITDQTRASKWIDWNRYADEKSYASAFRQKLVSSGFNSSIGMLIDTSRNGWGGPNRPTKASTASDVNTMVNESRIDRRIHAGNWCNQSGAGIGERPQAVGADGIHAYVWVKPPGESDGASKTIPNPEGKSADQMCDPAYTGNARNGNSLTGSLPDAPLAGAWFHAQLVQLVQNAHPPIDVSGGTDPTPGPTPTPGPSDFQLVASPSSLTLNQGESGAATILLGKSGGFSGTVALSASGLPNGVTASFSPSSTSGESTLTLTASSGAATGLATVTITGASGSLTHTATLYVNVATSGSATYSLSASPSAVTLAQGGSGTATITVQASNGFSGAVALSASGLPSGVTASFASPSTTSGTTVTLTASSTSATGSGTVTIAGAGGGVNKATTIALRVTGSGGSSGGSSSGGWSSGGAGSSGASGSGGWSSGGNSSGGWSSGGTSSGGWSSGGTGSSGGTSSSGGGFSSGGPSSGGNSVVQGGGGGCSAAGRPDGTLLLLCLGGALVLGLRRRRG